MVIIKRTDMDHEYVVDETLSLGEMESACPEFFKTPHGTRETYHVHRGFLIVRNTVTFDRQKTRRTNVYVFAKGDQPSLIIWNRKLSSIKHAQKLIDHLIEIRECHYGMSIDI